MLRKIIALDKTYYVNWTANDVSKLLELNSVRASDLIQSSKSKTKKLVKELFLLACKASLNSKDINNRESVVLASYANSIRQISNEYENIFRRTVVSEEMNETRPENDITINSIDRLQARLFYLITQYSLHPCTHLAAHIVKQLTNLCQHPHIDLMPAQHYIYSNSLNYWRSRIIHNRIPASKQELH